MSVSHLFPRVSFFFLMVICNPCVNIAATSSTDRMKGEMLQIFELLKQGEKYIQLDPNHRDVVLLIGNTGTGKTTIGLMLTTDCNRLESYYRNGMHFIRDVWGKIGTKTIVSKTIFPELMVNYQNGVAFYDCPGFRDTRKNTSIEFANTLFYKKITDHARSVKVVILVNYASVTPTANHDLEDVLRNPEDVPKAEGLLEALIEDGKNGKPKIHFTAVPTRAGVLTELPEMMAARERIGDIVYNGLDYVDVTADDFGYPFSPEARELETFILREIDTSTRRQMSRLADEFRGYWNKRMANSSNTDVQEVLRDLKDAKELLQPLIQSENNDTTIPKTKDLMRDALEIFKELGIHDRSRSADLQLFEDQDRFLDLLQKVHGSVSTIDPKKWVQPFQRVMAELQGAIDWFQILVELNRQLCANVVGNSSESCQSSTRLTGSGSRATYIDGKNFRQLFDKLKQNFGTDISAVPAHKFKPEYKTLTIKFLNETINRMSETRTRIVQSFGTGTKLAINHHFLAEDHGLTLQEFERSMASVATALTNVLRQPSDGTVAPTRLLLEIQTALASVRSQNILSLESVAMMNDQVAITQFLVSAASPELEKLSRADTLRPLEEAKTFLTQAIVWFNFIDQLRGNISSYEIAHVQQVSDDSATEANYVLGRSILATLENLSKTMGLQMPPIDSMNATFTFLNLI